MFAGGSTAPHIGEVVEESGDGGERRGCGSALACELVTRMVVCRACRVRVAIAVRNTAGL